jgi:hypothetical protein
VVVRGDKINRYLTFLAGVAALALVLPASTSAGSAGAPCWPSGTRTVAATGDVRVYYRGASDNHQRYACVTRTGRRWKLGRFTTASYGPGVVNVDIAGRFVAFQYVSCSDGCGDSDVRVLDTRSGRLRRSPKARAGFDGLSGLVVSRRGTVGYIARFESGEREVHVFDGASDRVVDSGPGIELNSIAFAGNTLYWTRDGVAQAVRT